MKPHILGPRLDWPLIILAPAMALVLGLGLAFTPLGSNTLKLFGTSGTPADGFLGAFIMAHLVIVFFRSHANPRIFALHPFRFRWVPVLLFAALMGSLWVRAAVVVLATWWDVYHSSLQTFGIGRIYDVKDGNDPEIGRRLDWWLNIFLYIGPILGGTSLLYHLSSLHEFSGLPGSVFFTALPDAVMAKQRQILMGVLAVSVPFAGWYCFSYYRLSQAGYHVSRRKSWLLGTTAIVSIWAWGFNPFGMALFIMNFFHALQYFAVVWAYEEKNILRVFGLTEKRSERILGLSVFVGSAFLYGCFSSIAGDQSDVVLSLTLVVSIMHFWYDGFVWSVRKKQA
ncbi:MAG: hypothetical protein COB53_08250 [Elusimicrobia bacterium]|nr:MAG: hypothetical protein COB53_08250 [Elusimicrobiota bacterium]